MEEIKPDFCCDNMFSAIEEIKIVDYDNVVRDYGIRFKKNKGYMVMRLTFCPWCGQKLPKGLMSKLFQVLEEEYGIPLEKADIDTYTNVPKEFKTDEWWKKRGL